MRGAQHWAYPVAQRLARPYSSLLWLGNECAVAFSVDKFKVVPQNKALQLLGRECDCVVYDGWSGLDPDALGITSGLVRGGGVFILLLPDEHQLGTFVDPQNARIAVYPFSPESLTKRWLLRFLSCVESSTCPVVIHSGDVIPTLNQNLAGELRREFHPTPEQERAIEAISELAQQASPGAVFVSADRGRGKSTALGMALARLAQRDVDILVTAPSRVRASVLFKSMGTLADQVQFLSPDEILRRRLTADLLVVDEAASLPASVLAPLLERFPRVVFSATLRGYEGSGRGFALRFQALLDQKRPGWKRLLLTKPVRWDENDPFERFANHALLLDAEASVESPVAAYISSSDLIFERLDRDELVQNEGLLREVFGLLVDAHYQTGPMDLRHLLDGPNLSVFVAKSQAKPIAVLLAAREGDLDATLLTEIQYGRRRPKGHLMPQTLIFSGALEPESGVLSCLRVVRIAVHPLWQRRDIGQQLLAHVEQWSRSIGCSYIGASFGLSDDLCRFWQRNGYFAVHLGLTRNKASAMRSVLMVKPFDQRAESVLTFEQHFFVESFNLLRCSEFKDLDDSTASLVCLPGHLEGVNRELELAVFRRYRQLCEAVAWGHRGITASVVPIRQLLGEVAGTPACRASSIEADLELIESKILLLRSWQKVATQFGLSGKREGEQRFRQSLRSLLNCTKPE